MHRSCSPIGMRVCFGKTWACAEAGRASQVENRKSDGNWGIREAFCCCCCCSWVGWELMGIDEDVGCCLRTGQQCLNTTRGNLITRIWWIYFSNSRPAVYIPRRIILKFSFWGRNEKQPTHSDLLRFYSVLRRATPTTQKYSEDSSRLALLKGEREKCLGQLSVPSGIGMFSSGSFPTGWLGHRVRASKKNTSCSQPQGISQMLQYCCVL